MASPKNIKTIENDKVNNAKLSNKMGNIDCILTLSDLHCGCDWGLMPPAGSFQLYDGAMNTQNPLQAIIWEAFKRDTDKALSRLKGRDFLLLLNGDLVEGIHHKNDAALAKIEDHKRCAIYCLKDIAKRAKRVVVVEGTQCHVRRDEEGIAKALGSLGRGKLQRFTFDNVDLNICGRLVNVTHHIGTTSRAYLEASGMGINMGNLRLNRARDGQPIPQVLFRGHRHCSGVYSDGRGIMVITGAYQFKTTYGMKVVPDSGTHPSVAITDWKGKEQNELPTVELIGQPINQIETVMI